MPTPKEPRSDGPRLRARARTGPSDALRPEVAAALEGLERSIGDVAAREQGLAGTEGGTAPAEAPADLVLQASVTPTDPTLVPDVAPPTRSGLNRLEGGLDLGLPAVVAAAAGVGEVAPEPDLDLSVLREQAAVEAAAADPAAPWSVLPGPVETRNPAVRQARRRRNGRILSWAGAVVLVGVAAWLLLPGNDTADTGDRDTTTTVEATTTTQVRVPVDGPVFPTRTTEVTVPVTTPATVAPTATTPTTARRRTTTTTTRAPVVTTPPTVATTTTTVRPTTTTTPTTVPPTTPTTVCFPGGVPDPEHGTC